MHTQLFGEVDCDEKGAGRFDFSETLTENEKLSCEEVINLKNSQ